MKWVAQMPQPAAAASKLNQTSCVRPVVALARWNRLIATALAKKQTATCKHDEAPVVVNRQASVDLEHCAPYLLVVRI